MSTTQTSSTAINTSDLVRAWCHAGNPTPPLRLSRYADALAAGHSIGSYRVLDDSEEESAILAMYRVDRPGATFADLHQAPPLSLSSYQQLLHDLAREGLGPRRASADPGREATGLRPLPDTGAGSRRNGPRSSEGGQR
jgi:hypothetical protein